MERVGIPIDAPLTTRHQAAHQAKHNGNCSNIAHSPYMMPQRNPHARVLMGLTIRPMLAVERVGIPIDAPLITSHQAAHQAKHHGNCSNLAHSPYMMPQRHPHARVLKGLAIRPRLVVERGGIPIDDPLTTVTKHATKQNTMTPAQPGHTAPI